MLYPVVEVTRLLSNLIKYPFVNMQGKEAVVLSYEKEDKFVPIQKSSRVVVKSAEEVAKEDKIKKEQEKNKQVSPTGEDEDSQFSSGVLPVVNVAKMMTEKEEEARQSADRIISEAQQQADSIVVQARQQADEIREGARTEGWQQGHDEGVRQASEEYEEERRKLKQEKQEHEQEYQQLLLNIEPQYIEILCSLIQKITGILVTDRKDIFTHLIRSSIEEMEPSKKYVVRVCPDDAIYLEAHKDEILLKVGSDVSLTVQEEKGLNPNDCIIETDHQMVDCGFYTQLDNMISTLRMLS